MLHTPPNHVAFIIDGNRRWAKALQLPPFEGHDAGLANVKVIDDACRSAGINWRSYYLFSRENARRDPEEVRHLIDGFTAFFTDWPQRQGECLHIVGDLTAPPISDTLRAAADQLLQRAHCVDTKGSNIVFFLNYSGAPEWSTASSTRCLEHMPDIDLLVRTGGEQRLSGLVLPQVAFSELAFPSCYWPDFDSTQLADVIKDYRRRDRRFGAGGVTPDRWAVGGPG